MAGRKVQCGWKSDAIVTVIHLYDSAAQLVSQDNWRLLTELFKANGVSHKIRESLVTGFLRIARG